MSFLEHSFNDGWRQSIGHAWFGTPLWGKTLFSKTPEGGP